MCSKNFYAIRWNFNKILAFSQISDEQFKNCLCIRMGASYIRRFIDIKDYYVEKICNRPYVLKIEIDLFVSFGVI